ncbi:LysM peptidoglycan-binding domain-containing protein [Beijerinckia mobilis]|uniref:LysM peptidoglycan-binding domain-containing protein n=1 Tax=Beijerinckia mobilis TaxID=231434 RepID=UPI000553A995|nr:LysM peptidoglycan-binding domain-containing protein [Beijerinckia mobilis]
MGLLQIACLAHARAGQLAIPFFGGPHAQLAADIFGCYLDGSMRLEVLSRIVKAVQGHTTHQKIVAFIKERIEGRQASTGRKLAAPELLATAAQAVDEFRMPMPDLTGSGDIQMVKPYFSGDLQQVISGIHSIGLINAYYKDELFNVVVGSYNIKDAYDFDNDRSMFPFYDKYRKNLAAFYVEDDNNPLRLYSKCITTYEADLALAPTSGGSPFAGPLNRPLIFTAFMYAIEIGGCTKSLPWSADIPFTINLASGAIQSPIKTPDGREPSVPRVPSPPLPDLPGAHQRFKLKTLKPRPAPEPETRTYVVKRGDTLSALAQRIYGDASKWKKIYEANRAVIGANPNLILVGQTLVLPPL